MRREIKLNIFQKSCSKFGIQENSQLKKEIEKLKKEAAKTSAKLESELNEARNLIQQLKTVEIFELTIFTVFRNTSQNENSG